MSVGMNSLTLEYLRAKSAVNMAYFFKEYLLMIKQGTDTYYVMPQSVYDCLKRHGLAKTSMDHKRCLTEYGLECLERVEKWQW